VQAGGTIYEWTQTLAVFYTVVSATLFLRLVLGIIAAWRLRRSAQKPSCARLDDSRALISDSVTAPVTIGSTVLLPTDALQWSAYKLQAVLAHETSHVSNGDFYWHVISLLYRAIFWINPLAWWLPKRMAELAEARCDQIAVTAVGEPTEYAQLLVDFSKKPTAAPLAVSMARSADVQQRVEQVLGEQADDSAHNGLIRKIGVYVMAMATILICASCERQTDAQHHAANAPTTQAAEKEVVVSPRIPEGGSTKPKYDSSEREAGHQGTVYLQVLIDAGGRVAKVIIQKSSGYEALDNSALTEIRDHWRFLPGTSNGVLVDMWVTIPIVFTAAMKSPNPLAHGLAQLAYGNVDALV
jgi:TonB family protein